MLQHDAALIGWDEPGGTYDHVAPGPRAATGCRRRRPDSLASPSTGRGTASPRSSSRGSRAARSTTNTATSLIATMTKLWDIGGPFTERDKAAKPIDYVFSRETPRGPDEWSIPVANPVPQTKSIGEAADKTMSNLGKAAIPEYSRWPCTEGNRAATGGQRSELPPDTVAGVRRPDVHLHFSAEARAAGQGHGPIQDVVEGRHG